MLLHSVSDLIMFILVVIQLHSTLTDSTLYFIFVVFVVEKQPEEEESQLPISTQNGSPRLNRVEVTSRQSPEAYDVLLQRKENEGFGFVILTTKNKPPPGGKG